MLRAIETDFGGGRLGDNVQLKQMVASATALGRTGLPDDPEAVFQSREGLDPAGNRTLFRQLN